MTCIYLDWGRYWDNTLQMLALMNRKIFEDLKCINKIPAVASYNTFSCAVQLRQKNVALTKHPKWNRCQFSRCILCE